MKCDVCGRSEGKIIKSKIYEMTLCKKHYKQLESHGKILDNNPRTKKDLNEIISHKDYAEIVLYNKETLEVARTKIDLEDVERVKNIKWSLNNGYVECSNRKNRVKLHRLLMNITDDVLIDHKDLNPLNNQKENLRICTISQNGMNRDKPNNNTSGVRGIHFDKSRNKWMAHIRVNGENKWLGRFDKKDDAIKARQEAEIKYFGDFRFKGDVNFETSCNND